MGRFDILEGQLDFSGRIASTKSSPGATGGVWQVARTLPSSLDSPVTTPLRNPLEVQSKKFMVPMKSATKRDPGAS